MARTVITALNKALNASLPQIRDSEALAFLGIDPNQAYFDWLDEFQLKHGDLKDDPDGDGWFNIVEYAFGTSPQARDVPAIWFRWEAGALTIGFRPNAERRRHIQIWPQWSADLREWTDLPGPQVQVWPDAWVTGTLAGSGGQGFLRLRVSILSPE